MEPVIVIGAGLAGSEAAWQLARRGVSVTLREMKPAKMTPAHHTEWFGELVCSNSLRSDQLENAVGLLKEELRRMDSLILTCADAHRVEAGGALAVDRHGFARAVTEKIRSHPLITVEEGEVTHQYFPFHHCRCIGIWKILVQLLVCECHSCDLTLFHFTHDLFHLFQ